MSAGNDERSVLERASSAIERHPARALVWGAVAALVSLASAFIGGFSCHKELVESAGMESVPRGAYILRSELSAYLPKSEVQENFIPKEVLNQQYIPRSALGSDYVRRSDCLGSTISTTTSTADPRPASSLGVGEAAGITMELLACKRSGTTVTCHVRMTNKEDERNVTLAEGGWLGGSRAIDNSGEVHKVEKTAIGGDNAGKWASMPTGVSFKGWFRFRSIPPDRSTFELLELEIQVGDRGHKIKFDRAVIAP